MSKPITLVNFLHESAADNLLMSVTASQIDVLARLVQQLIAITKPLRMGNRLIH